MKEKDLVKKIRDSLERRGFFTWKNHGNEFSLAGLPDVMAVHDGKLYAFEVKLPGNRPTAIQVKRLDQLRQHGAFATWVDSLEGLHDALLSFGVRGDLT